jgi:hypothetical protein
MVLRVTMRTTETGTGFPAAAVSVPVPAKNEGISYIAWVYLALTLVMGVGKWEPST